VRRLLPGPVTDVEPADAYADPTRQRRADRPWILVNMISSADGATTVAGRSGGLGGPSDRAVFHALRELADMVLVGAGTARAEGYGPPKKPGQRIAVVTRTGALDYDLPLFQSGAALVITSETAPELPVETIRAGTSEVDLAAALAELPADVVACEGGPSLNGALHAIGAIDEWCLTLAPALVGGASARAISRGPDDPAPVRLVHVLEADGGFLFTRYVRA
jgi:riboflavin biosynthesis pyrimidine reductase